MRTNKLKKSETMIAYSFLAPILLFFLIFVFAPMFMGYVTRY
ncbi:sugar ABC transporter permease, partial [Streptococcus agalactiae]|nr:sugar ABC transporter permease [Streptococcus agalactiae]MCK6342009.1 sugar ABC transporter permease [Streptococcus agalactiae]